LAGNRADPASTHLIWEPVIWTGFCRGTGKSDKQVWITFEQSPGQFDITHRRPPSQRQQVACVRVEQDEWRRTDTRIFAPQQGIDFRNFGQGRPKLWEALTFRRRT